MNGEEAFLPPPLLHVQQAQQVSQMLAIVAAVTLTTPHSCVDCAITDLCPEGFTCSDALNSSACPAGFACPVGSLC